MIREYYPRAWQHLDNARRAETAMARLWNTLLDGGLVEEGVVTHPDGSGFITAWLAWPPDGQAQLAELFRGCVQELWACLDALVTESVEAFSALQRLRRPECPRFFPVADSLEGFRESLAESCMDGALRSQVAMVEDCQPFQASDGDDVIDRLRRGLGHLLAWEAALDAGAVMGAWATPVEPQVRAAAPAVVESVSAAQPGALGEQEQVLARYQLTSYRSGCAVTAPRQARMSTCASRRGSSQQTARTPSSGGCHW
ncbi:hypothetical protein [Streptomyces sp. NPDC001410]|uniref:hypothetical protein n=1 Tax=Streptomyces sp. NPDC001410 TaxID=3364574 RepID=UPI00368C0701